MAQIGAQYPNLATMYGEGSILGSQLGLEQFDAAQDSNRINQVQGIQDLFQTEQERPLKQRKMELENQGLEAGLPGIFGDSQSRAAKGRVDTATLESTIAAKNSKNKTDISDDDAKHLGNLAQMMAYSDDPKIREQGEKLMRMHADVVKDRAKQQYIGDRNMEVERLRGANARGLMGMQIDAGRFDKKGSGKGPTSVEDAINSGKLGYEKAAVLLNGAADAAELDGDDEKAANYRARANAMAIKNMEQKAAAGAAPRAGTPDLGALGVTPNPERPMAPLGSPKAPVAKPVSAPAAAIEFLKKNPGLQAEFDQKYGPGAAAKALGK